MAKSLQHAGRRWSRMMVFLLLFAVAIPWYWRWLGLSPGARTWGMPTWFVVAVAGSFAISVAAAWQLSTPWATEAAAAKDKREP